MLYVGLAIMLLVLIVFYTGIIHLAWYFQVRAEKTKQHLAYSTNGKDGFLMQIAFVTNTFYHKKVTGRFKGALPGVGDVLLLVNKEKNQLPVRVLKVKKGNYDYDSNTFDVSIVLFGAKEAFLKDGCNLTNLRKEANVVKKKEINYKKRADICYPVVVKSTVRDYLRGFGICCLGAAELFVVIASIVTGLSVDLTTIIIGGLGLLFFLTGVYFIGDAILFKIVIEEDGSLRLVKLFKDRTYKANEYNYSARVLRSNGKESYEIYIMDPQKQHLWANVADTNPSFNDLYNALKQK